MVPPPRSLLEGYVNEFQDTIESTRSKLDRAIGVSTTKDYRCIEFNAIKIPNEIPDRDLWVQLRQQTIEMQKLMYLTGSSTESYGRQVIKFGEQVRARTRLPTLMNSYVSLVIRYGYTICAFGRSGILCSTVRVAGTPRSLAEIEKDRARHQFARDMLEQRRGRLQRKRAELEQQHHQGGGTPTSIVVLPLPQEQPMMKLPIPHEEILDDGVLMITKFQSILTDAGIY